MQFCTQTDVQTIIATTKLDCFKTLKVAYKNSTIKVLPLSFKQKNYRKPETSTRFNLSKACFHAASSIIPRCSKSRYRRNNIKI